MNAFKDLGVDDFVLEEHFKISGKLKNYTCNTIQPEKL